MKLQNFTLWLSEAEAGLGAGKTNGECGESKLAVAEPIDWLLFLWQDKPVVVGAVVVVCEFSIWILHRFFFGNVPKLLQIILQYLKCTFIKIIFGTLKYLWRIQILNLQKTTTAPTTTSLSCQRKRSQYMGSATASLDWLLFLWQDKPIVVGAVVVVCEFNIWILHRFFFESVPKLFSKLDFAENFTVFEMYLKQFLGLWRIYEGFKYWIHRHQQWHQQQRVYLVREKEVNLWTPFSLTR